MSAIEFGLFSGIGAVKINNNVLERAAVSIILKYSIANVMLFALTTAFHVVESNKLI